MNILVLEDDRARQQTFAQKLIGTNAVIVETAAEAIQALSEGEWDYLFLDHDLGGQQMVESGPGTGYEVAEWLAEHPEHQPPNIIIHSFNPSGAENIHRALPNATVAPGCWTSISIS
jgi:CheY-like chemotaxis protein